MAVSSNTVLGKYRIIREIARSNDIVYEAIDPTMARRVAIKELQLPPHLAGAQKRERIERFYREAKAAGTLSHRNIVTIHDVGQEDDRHFLVMEYLEGQSLRDILQMQGALPLKETVEITLQLCDALAYAHSRGVVHRDIKPDNIHILPGGVIKLTDFGIARITAEPSITTQGQVFGTPSYMSPEQVASHTVDHRTDLFSMGITLYEMLTGRKPFVGDSVITITYNIMNIQPIMPVGVPSALQQILQRALAKDPNMRYQNAAAMAADLRAEKFALAAPPPAQAAHVSQTPPLTFAPGPPLTLETGTVPPEISGMPVASPTAAQTYPAYPPSSSQAEPTQAVSRNISAQPGQRQGRYVQAGLEKFFSLALPIMGLIALLLLIVWGIIHVVSALQPHHAENTPTTPAVAALVRPDDGAARPVTLTPDPLAVGLAHSAVPTAVVRPDSSAPPPASSTASASTGPATPPPPLTPAPPAPSDSAIQEAVRRDMAEGQAAIDRGDDVQAREAWSRVIQRSPGSDEAFQAQQYISNPPTPGSQLPH
ncbi:MAG: serine/threonine protein kinase [Armatimonadota bacterium]|nr:serine/threonine protein kinase [Armatimonadota bacterium]